MTLVPVKNDEAPESGVASTGLGLARADAALLPQTRAPQLQPSEQPRHVIAGTSHSRSAVAEEEEHQPHSWGLQLFFLFPLYRGVATSVITDKTLSCSR